MDMCFNTKGRDQRDIYISLVCKRAFNGRRKKVQQLAQNKRVPILFEKNAWVDTEVATVLAHGFVNDMRNKHRDVWILLYLDNLSVYCNAEVRHIYWQGKVFLYYYLPQIYKSTQAID